MNSDTKFLIVKDKKTKQIKYFDYDKIDGYKLTKKKNSSFFDDINISSVILINPSFSEKIARKKMNAKFERLLTMMNIVCEEDDSGEGLDIVLDEANKLKMELWNKYKKYLAKEKLDLMIKKIEILEDELNLRLNILMNSLYEQENLNKGHSR